MELEFALVVGMKKKILIGSIIVVALLILMPSISAIEHKTIREEIKQNIEERIEESPLNNLKSLKNLDIQDSSGFVHKLLGNNYDFGIKFNPWNVLFDLIVLIVGLITWAPAIMFSLVLAIPIILFYTIASTLYNFPWYFNPLIFIVELIGSFIYGVANWLEIFIIAILWPYLLVNYENPNPYVIVGHKNILFK